MWKSDTDVGQTDAGGLLYLGATSDERGGMRAGLENLAPVMCANDTYP